MNAQNILSSALRLAAGLALVMSISAVAHAGDDFKVPEGVTVLTEDEIREKIIGNTMTGTSGSKRWTEYYLPNGVIKGVEAGEKYGGKWTLSGSVMCFDYSGDEYDTCDTLALEGTKVRFFKLDGTPSDYATGEILEGNASGL